MPDRRSLLAGLGAGFTAAALPARARAADALHIASIPLDAGAEAYYAYDLGYFRDAGIDAQVDSIPSGAAIASAVASGAIDIGFSNLISIAVAYKHNVPVTLLAPGSLYTASIPTSVLMVPKNSPVKTARDLNGKTLAVNGLKTITQYAPQLLDRQERRRFDHREVHRDDVPADRRVAGRRAASTRRSSPTRSSRKRRPARAFSPTPTMRSVRATSSAAGSRPRSGPPRMPTSRPASRKSSRAPRSGPTRTSRRAATSWRSTRKMDPALAATMLRVDYAPRFDKSEMQPVIDLAARYGGLAATFPADELVYKP